MYKPNTEFFSQVFSSFLSIIGKTLLGISKLIIRMFIVFAIALMFIFTMYVAGFMMERGKIDSRVYYKCHVLNVCKSTPPPQAEKKPRKRQPHMYGQRNIRA